MTRAELELLAYGARLVIAARPPELAPDAAPMFYGLARGASGHYQILACARRPEDRRTSQRETGESYASWPVAVARMEALNAALWGPGTIARGWDALEVDRRRGADETEQGVIDAAWWPYRAAGKGKRRKVVAAAGGAA